MVLAHSGETRIRQLNFSLAKVASPRYFSQLFVMLARLNCILYAIIQDGQLKLMVN